MKTLLIILLLSASLQAEFLQEDKKLHIAAGLITYGGCIFIGQILKKQNVTDLVDSTTCVLPVIAIGAAKEIYDHRSDGHVADFNDFTATVVTPLIISYSIQF